MGQDPKYKLDDIIGVIALVLLFIGVALAVFVATQSPGPPLPVEKKEQAQFYDTPNGLMPNEKRYLDN